MWDLAALTFALVLAAPAKPAETAGTLRGTVLDTSRAPIRGARVIASGRQLAVTDNRGVFTVRRPAGECEVRIVSAGFDDSVRTMTVGFVRSGSTSTGNSIVVRTPRTMSSSASAITIARLWSARRMSLFSMA